MLKNAPIYDIVGILCIYYAHWMWYLCQEIYFLRLCCTSIIIKSDMLFQIILQRYFASLSLASWVIWVLLWISLIGMMNLFCTSCHSFISFKLKKENLLHMPWSFSLIFAFYISQIDLVFSLFELHCSSLTTCHELSLLLSIENIWMRCCFLSL